MPVITRTYNVESCTQCPCLTTGTTFGNDGRDGHTVYICTEGAFGTKKGAYCGYSDGPSICPRVPPIGCPYIKSSAIDRLASRLLIDTKTLEHALEAEKIKLEDI